MSLDDSWYRNSKKNSPYPCLCEAFGGIFSCYRLAGILPIVSVKSPHVVNCSFAVSRKWLIYSLVIHAIYISYVIFAYSLRFYCGPQYLGSEWYLMTSGYLLSDISTVIILLANTYHANDICEILHNLCVIPGHIGEIRNFKNVIKVSFSIVAIVTISIIGSFLYVAVLRFQNQEEFNWMCYLLDKPFGVAIRGLVIIFPSLQLSLAILLYALLSGKFQRLADKTILTLEGNADTLPQNLEIVRHLEHNLPPATNHGLIQLSDTHRNVTACLERINKSIGLQVLSEVAVNLYSIVCYLYRYSTADGDAKISNNREKFHYLLGFIHRITKLMSYIILGYRVSVCAYEPLDVLRKVRIINFPMALQQQVQSLILQWSTKQSYLSVFGVINVGPWLLAPIIGNIITYLLVALQFNSNSRDNILGNASVIVNIQ